MSVTSGEVTFLLLELGLGNKEAEGRLIPLVYRELRRIAATFLRRESPDHSLQPTALVHEAYIRLIERSRSRTAWPPRCWCSHKSYRQGDATGQLRSRRDREEDCSCRTGIGQEIDSGTPDRRNGQSAQNRARLLL